MTDRSLGHRAPLLWLVAPLIVGLAIGKLTDAAVAWPWLACALAAALGAVFTRCAIRWIEPLIVTAMISAGIASFAVNRPRLSAWDELPTREADLTVRIDRVFGTALPNRLPALVTIIRAAEPLDELAGQRAYVSLSLRRGEEAPLRSSVVRITGLITPLPRRPATSSFDGYLVNAGMNFRVGRARLREVVRPPNAYRRFCAKAEAQLESILGAGVAADRPRLVAVYRAMMLGQQHELSEDQTTLFRQTGTMHVFSISGLHIAAIALGLHGLLSALRLPGWLQYPLGLTALWLYVDVTGAAPSAVRAFVMVALVQSSFVLKLPRNAVAALVGSALLILLFAPLQLFSASFQMSYGIVAALLLLGLPLAEALNRHLALFKALPEPVWAWHHHWRRTAWRWSLDVIAIGLAASLVSAVTGIDFFQLLTPGSFLVNLWLIPASTFVIYFGFIALLCGLAGFTAGAIFANHAAVLLLWTIEQGVARSVELPAMWLTAAFRAPWLGPVALGVLLATIVAGYARNWTGWARGFWPPFAAVALTLLLAVKYS